MFLVPDDLIAQGFRSFGDDLDNGLHSEGNLLSLRGFTGNRAYRSREVVSFRPALHVEI